MDKIPTEYNDIHPHPLEPAQIKSVGDETQIAHHHPNANIVATIIAKKPTAPAFRNQRRACNKEKITSHLCVDQGKTLEQAMKGTIPDQTTKEEESN